ncbi:hypothetical protein BX616_001599 [Lobosporangium transversale]|uniref:Beta-lactamase-like protein n=1 Tax=Lobosporangium transversale TaxID=64571 RepID=A0A1Y2H160_9FUNG|nr:beta-lactamase-like protein [Lobosporangium transversale]KAF9903528.1 hypothetical protein BX616_001599 [Lobosporangium transversale]ORZ28288.1 beta-lactamase-like protein [Lobosporangium transversale]|eukprot:XP_021885973.1 beta-lactamase-like protein [Lobosporangium transversale]
MATSTPTTDSREAEPNLFPDLIELDALRLTVIVDNDVDFMTSVPRELGQTAQAIKLFSDKRNIDWEKTTEKESANTHEREREHEHEHGHGHEDVHPHTQDGERPVRTIAFDFNDVCCGAHGLSILVTGIKDGVEHRILFDTGPHSAIFLDNARRLELEFEKIEVVVLSHWHIDHSGGMIAAVEKIREAREKKQGLSPVVVDLHPDRPDQRGTCLTKSLKVHNEPEEEPIQYVAWGADPSLDGLKKAGAQVSLKSQAHTICDGFFGVSGLIPRKTSYETGIPNHVRWFQDSKSWKPEPEIMDERYLVARVRSKGLVVLTGCSHAGVINVCQDVKHAFDPKNSNNSNSNSAKGSDVADNQIFFVVGGFHLAGHSVETRIKETIDDMLKIDPSFMAPGHCSGWRAKAALEQAMPGRVASLGVGSDFYIHH